MTDNCFAVRATGGVGLYSGGTIKLDTSADVELSASAVSIETGTNYLSLADCWGIDFGDWGIMRADENIDFFAGTNNMRLRGQDGALSVAILEVRGGSDVAEPFAMSTGELAKGSVVVIDEEHPGQLKESMSAYDTRVAGTIRKPVTIKAAWQPITLQ